MRVASLTSTFVLGYLLLPFAFAHAGPGSGGVRESVVAFSGLAATAEHEIQSGSPLGDQLLGFEATSSGDEVEVRVLRFVSDHEADEAKYGCHFHLDAAGKVEDAHCHAESDVSRVPYDSGKRAFTAADFTEATAEALAVFKKKVADPKRIETFKIWQSGGNIELHVKHREQAAGRLKSTYLMCHIHDGHLDCHKQSRPGPNEI